MEETQGARVVVGYDGGPDGDLALAWGIETARREGRPLRVVVATTAMDPVLISGFRAQADELAGRWRDRAEKILAESGANGGLAAVVEVQHGPTLRVLLTAVRADDLLVVGSTGHSPFVESVGGSVSQHLARHAPCPVVVVRTARTPDAGRIAVGVDGSPESIAAVRFACARARTSGEQVLAVHAYHRPPWEHDDPQVQHRHVAQRRDRAMARLAEWLAPVRAEHPDVLLVAHATTDRPHDLLAHLSDRASLLVVGSRGRDAFTDLLLGSTTQDVLQRAHCPVAVVR